VNNRSAGQNRSRHTTGGDRWLRGTLNECTSAAAAQKDCFLKDKFWRITTQSGGKKAPAIIAMAHSLLILTYQVLSTGQAYQEKQAPVSDPLHKQGMIRHPIRRLGKLGIRVRMAATWAPPQQPPRDRLLLHQSASCGLRAIATDPIL
jgi:hypothetical protein